MDSKLLEITAQLLYNQSIQLDQIEKIKLQLAQNEFFEPHAMFQRIDRNNSSYISMKEISQFINSITGQFIVDQDLSLVIRKFSNQKESKWDYQNFEQFILPIDKNMRDIIMNRITFEVNFNEKLPYDIEIMVAQIFIKEINIIFEFDPIKEKYMNMDYMQNIFQTISQNNSFIGIEQLKDFFQQYFVVQPHLLHILLSRFDKDQDQRICYTEFIEIMMPLASIKRKQPAKSSMKKYQSQSQADVKAFISNRSNNSISKICRDCLENNQQQKINHQKNLSVQIQNKIQSQIVRRQKTTDIQHINTDLNLKTKNHSKYQSLNIKSNIQYYTQPSNFRKNENFQKNSSQSNQDSKQKLKQMIQQNILINDSYPKIQDNNYINENNIQQTNNKKDFFIDKNYNQIYLQQQILDTNKRAQFFNKKNIKYNSNDIKTNKKFGIYFNSKENNYRVKAEKDFENQKSIPNQNMLSDQSFLNKEISEEYKQIQALFQVGNISKIEVENMSDITKEDKLSTQGEQKQLKDFKYNIQQFKNKMIDDIDSIKLTEQSQQQKNTNIKIQKDFLQEIFNAHNNQAIEMRKKIEEQQLYYQQQFDNQYKKQQELFQQNLQLLNSQFQENIIKNISNSNYNIDRFSKKSKENIYIQPQNYITEKKSNILNVFKKQSSQQKNIMETIRELLIFQREISFELNQLLLDKKFTFAYIFKEINEENLEYLTDTQFKNGLLNIGININDQQLDLIRWRFNYNKKQHIGFKEFCDLFNTHLYYFGHKQIQQDIQNKSFNNIQQKFSKVFYQILDFLQNIYNLKKQISIEELNQNELLNYLNNNRKEFFLSGEINHILFIINQCL